MKPHTNSPSQRAHTYDGFSDKQHIRSPMPIPPSQGDQPSCNEKLLDMKKFPNVHDIKEKKDYLEKMMNEIISNVGESFEIKQSVKELRNIFNRNEVQLRDLKNQTTDPQASLLQKAELNRKIENLMDTNKKHKEIEDQFRNKFKMNDHQLGELKSCIIKMFEDQFSFILRLEFKELQVKQENTALQMTNLSLSQDNSSKATLIAKLTQQVNELENMLKKSNQLHCPEPHLKQERVEEPHPQPTKMFQNVKKDADKPNPAMKIVQNFSTPKGDAKFQGAAKTQEAKKSTTINTLTNKKSFRLLKRETGKDTSPSPQPISIKLTSPMSYYQQDKRVKPKSFVSSKKLWSQSPSVVGPVKANNFDTKPNCSASQIFPKSLENITNIRPAPGRYSDVHEMNKDRSSVGKHETIKDFSSNKTSVEYNFMNPEKVKSFCQKNEKNPIFSSSSIELEKGSVSSLDPNGVHSDTAPSDFHSLLASEEYLHKQKVKTSAGTSNDLSSKNLQASTKHDSDPDYTVYQSNFRAVTEPDAPIRGINDEPSDSSSRRSLRKNSVYINLEENNVRPIDKVYTIVKKTSSQKKKTASFAELPPSGRQSSNKKSPNKPRITNLYASGQFSSTKKGAAYHSKHDSLVIYRTSTNKKCESKMDSNHKLIGSDLKNDYIENEVPEVKEPLQDSPQPLRVARNLLLKLK